VIKQSVRALVFVMVVLAGRDLIGHAAEPATHAVVTVRGHKLNLTLYGPPNGAPVIVSSGDGGWIHLGPHVAEVLAARGCFVVGLDVRGYLESFTAGKQTLQASDEPGDFRVLADFAARNSSRKPVLVGVSEGAGLSVMAAADPDTKSRIAGVLALGLPDINELGWRWSDAIIYVTHGVPKEPTFSTATFIANVSPVPLAAIHATHDEFVPLDEVQRVMAAAKEPKRLWVVPAADHRFSNNLAEFDRRLADALDWIAAHPAP
jgi:alpha-beta hydrolase superfamily lysophospholipase